MRQQLFKVKSEKKFSQKLLKEKLDNNFEEEKMKKNTRKTPPKTKK